MSMDLMAQLESNKRTLRSNTPSVTATSPPPCIVKPPITFSTLSNTFAPSAVDLLSPSSDLPDITPSELKLLRQKQQKLSRTASSTLDSLPTAPHITNALASTLIFAQELAGSAICIDSAGWILSCSHCFAEYPEDYAADSKRRWLLYYTGLAVQVECRAWDEKRDLALCKIIAVELPSGVKAGEIPAFSHVPLSKNPPALKSDIICIGQPGRDDLESDRPRKTKYNLVEVSEGKYHGIAPRADPQDNDEIGSLMHDAWTYWGHSGAPLLSEDKGELIGLHSSWDYKTGMRRGIPLVAIEAFLEENKELLPNGEAGESSH